MRPLFIQPRLGSPNKTVKTFRSSKPEPEVQEMSAFKKAEIDMAVKKALESEKTSTGKGRRRRRSTKTRKVRKSRRRH